MRITRTLPVLLTAALLGACGTQDPPADPAPRTLSPVVKPAERAPEHTPEPDPEPGSRGAPLSPGVEFAVGDYRLVAGVTVSDQTEEMMQAEADRYYSGNLDWVIPPAEGHVLVVMPLGGTYDGEDVGEPGGDLSTAYVGASGKVYSSYTRSSRPENDLHSIGEMYAGTQFSATLIQEVPEWDVEGGMWRISETFSLQTRRDIFVEGR